MSNPVIVLAILMTTPEHNLHSLGHLNRLVYEKLLGALYHKDLLSPKKARHLSDPTSTMQWAPLLGIGLIANYKIHHISAQILVKICTYHVIRMFQKVSTLNLTSQRVSTCKKVEEKGLTFGGEVMAEHCNPFVMQDLHSIAGVFLGDVFWFQFWWE